MQMPNNHFCHFGEGLGSFGDPRPGFENSPNGDFPGNLGDPRDGFGDPRRSFGNFRCGFGDPRSGFGGPRGGFNGGRRGFGERRGLFNVEFGPRLERKIGQYGFWDGRPHPYRVRSHCQTWHCHEHNQCGFDFEDGPHFHHEDEDSRWAFFARGFDDENSRSHPGFEFGGRGRGHHRGRGGYGRPTFV